MTTTGVEPAAGRGTVGRARRFPLRVALLGFGTVGQAVARILTEREELSSRLVLTHVFNRGVSRKRVPWIAESVVWTERIDDVFAADPDVVVEVVGGTGDAREWVTRALTQGRSVVTANKLLMAAHAPELIATAAAHGGRVRFEAAVAGGVPIIDAIRGGVGGDKLTSVTGILNGTCNFILSSMTAGDTMSAALAEAQRRGFAEADPTSDVDGHDAAAKLVLLAGVAFGRYVAAKDIPTGSIRRIDAIDFRYAKRLGSTIRQLSMVEAAGDDRLQAFVGPALVPLDSSFARNKGAQNLVMLSGKYGGGTTFSGEGAGGNPTAVAIVSDLLALTRGGRRASGDSAWLPGTIVRPHPRPYYLRFVVKDRPGILAAITAALARHDINVDAVLQEPGFPKDHLPFVVTVESCEEGALQDALQDVANEGFHAEPPLVLPVLPGEDHVAAVQ